MLIEVSVPNDFGLTAAEIKKMTKYQDLKNEAKRIWKLKKAEIIPVVVGGYRNDKENPSWVLKNHFGEHHHKRATSGGFQRFREDIDKNPWNEAMRAKFHSLVHES